MDKAYAYVPSAVNAQFEGYARRCGMTSLSELLKLLIKRELRLRRLPHAKDDSGVTRQQPIADRKKITAHLSPDMAESFASHIDGLGLSTSLAASLLVEGELTERWLEAAIGWEPRQ
ncbi:hypothetical protein ABIF07_005473 [Bradyrhizobium elkanii]|uniref:hypothetical protein n=1 Tax=Bradyrhizobium elkanii TaxID=29448 RepID=UPI002168FA52|nr:hypothetical protein [Bradyrhizobium elkanii]MCS3687500.1 hypothetical protein [Bradyrhizobium elkanii]